MLATEIMVYFWLKGNALKEKKDCILLILWSYLCYWKSVFLVAIPWQYNKLVVFLQVLLFIQDSMW